MAEKSSFFNSVSGDRKYKAEDWASYFGALIGNGVFPNPATNLQVVPGASGLTVTVHAGKAWINGYYYNNTDDLTLTLPTSDGSKKRIDRIVVRWSLSDRKISAEVKSGTGAANPSAAVLQRDSDVYELAIADVLVGVAATSITSASITDRRYDSTLCGVVTGTVQQIDTSAFAEQVQSFLDDSEAEFTTWLNGIKEVLDESTAGNLLNLINTHKADTNNPHQVTAAQIGAVTTSAMQTALDGKANTSHTQSASTITSGTLAGEVKANANAQTTLSNAQVRNISVGTADLQAGTSALTTGEVYVVYE